MTGRSPLSTIAIILGALCVVLALVYWFVPAGSLPAFMPGFEPGSADVHVKHGVAALVVGIVLIVASRFVGGGGRTAELR